MKSSDALLVFLDRALARKKERVIGFASKRKTRTKFLDMLYHQLPALFDERVVVEDLPERAWKAPAYLFIPPDEFGGVGHALGDVFEAEDGPILCISSDGRYGFFKDETYVDETCIINTERRRKAG